jgi:hypothetical protein
MRPLAERQAAFLADIFGEGPLDDGPAVYRRNVVANLHDALAAAYPVVRRLVGDAFFREAAERFAHGHASRSGDLHGFGAGFADFLAAYPHAAGLPYLPDVARLEWAVARAFHAADPGEVDFARLGGLPEAERVRVRFLLQAAAALIASEFPIAALWDANQPDRDGTPERTSGADRVLVHRDGFAVRVRALGALDWRFLEALAAGCAMETLAEDDALAPELERLLVQWTANHVIDDFATSRSPD